ncbi:Na+/H+ antiporter NhaA [Hymenobacter koreensis]|uniref:Na(+)/H(+) antiporter NhaA n=1 Tax=Hymenobacter koreensis TaxID=1084523 RepID=A0ABP8J3K9_9BACT
MPIRRIISPIRELSDRGQLAGVLLIMATAVSLFLSNSGVGPQYLAFWEEHVGFGALNKSISHWINDGLMAVFFFMVGLEIKREVLHGELSEPRVALMPALAALGGVVVPAGIHLAFTYGTPASSGWAIPSATDIAFSLGILSLLGDRVPFALRVFLTALAIIDDLLAVIIIAAFYTGGLHMGYLLAAAGIFAGLVVLNRLRVQPLPIYLLLGVALWFCVLESGVHATIAGVLLALAIPTERLEDLELALQRPVNYVVLPLFALCNTAIALSADILPQLASGLALGVGLGLFLGKPLGIVGVTWVVVRLGWGQLPTGVNWRRFIGLGFTAGIGFTMAIFIATLSYQTPEAVDLAKLAVLIGSAISALVGTLILAPGKLTEEGGIDD